MKEKTQNFSLEGRQTLFWGYEVTSCLLRLMLSSRIAPKPGSPFLICFACIASSPFFLLILMKRSAKQAGHLSVRGCQHVYRQIIRELGKRPPERKVPDGPLKRATLASPVCHVQRALSCRLPGLTMASKATRGGFKEQRGGKGMCDCAQDPNLFRGAEGSNPDLFHPAAQRRGFFPRALL